MTRLILTADSSSAGGVVSAGHADLAIAIEHRLVWGPPRSDAELVAFLEARTTQGPDSNWLYSLPRQRRQLFGFQDLGLIGPNGAGKSTTLRILTTLMPATAGTVVIGGHRVPEENDQVKPLLGLVPQEIALYDTLSARQNLRVSPN